MNGETALLIRLNATALLISMLALAFTVLSFWWMNWRRGTLKAGAPRSFAAFASGSSRLTMEFPLVFFNDGPTPIIVHDLRIVFVSEAPPRPLRFTATVDKMAKDEGRALATQFPVRGREAILLICEFQRQPTGIVLMEGTYLLELEAKLDSSKRWRPLCRFSLAISEEAARSIASQFVVFDIERNA